MNQKLDHFDRRILAVVSEEGRISWRDLSDRIGLSQTPTLRRVRALEESGLIAGYRAVIDPAALGLTLSAFVSVSLERQTEDALRSFEVQIAEVPEAVSCFMMTGGADYLVALLLPDVAAFHSVVQRIASIRGVSRLNTSFAVKTVFERHSPAALELKTVGSC